MRHTRTGKTRKDRTRTRFLLALRELDEAWVAAFHKSGFGDIYFSRLFTELWLRDPVAVSKTAAYDLVKGVSVQTAMKYVNKAVMDGFLEEIGNPADGRSRLLRMSPPVRAQFAQVIDRANTAFMAILNEAVQAPGAGTARRAMKSISTRAPRASAVTPTQVRAGSRPGSK